MIRHLNEIVKYVENHRGLTKVHRQIFKARLEQPISREELVEAHNVLLRDEAESKRVRS